MPEQLEDFLMTRAPTPERPLLGQTVLVVEDSRFACDAMRLLSLRSGARIRRADSLKSAARHLSTYRPSVVIIDIGLPDGSGLDLIREIAGSNQRISVILATSGDDVMEGAAMEAGADGFLPKPISSLAAFQTAILDILPASDQPRGPRSIPEDIIDPDPLALKEDLAHAVEIMRAGPEDSPVDYVTQFLSGIAEAAQDDALQAAADALAAHTRAGTPGHSAFSELESLITARLAAAADV